MNIARHRDLDYAAYAKRLEGGAGAGADGDGDGDADRAAVEFHFWDVVAEGDKGWVGSVGGLRGGGEWK